MNTQNAVHHAIETKKNLEKQLKMNLSKSLKFVQSLKSNLNEILSNPDQVVLDDMIERLTLLNNQLFSLDHISYQCKRVKESLTESPIQEAFNGLLSKESILSHDHIALKKQMDVCLNLVEELKNNEKHIETLQKQWLENQNKPKVTIAPQPVAPRVVIKEEDVTAKIIAEQAAIEASIKTKAAEEAKEKAKEPSAPYTPPQHSSYYPQQKPTYNATSTYQSRRRPLFSGIALAVFLTCVITVSLLTVYVGLPLLITGITAAIFAATCTLLIAGIAAAFTGAHRRIQNPAPYIPARPCSTLHISAKVEANNAPICRVAPKPLMLTRYVAPKPIVLNRPVIMAKRPELMITQLLFALKAERVMPHTHLHCIRVR